MGNLRIIAGKFKGRQVSVLDIVGLRPTPSRLRETLFNWLRPYLLDSSCLDCFAGSGALGFESISQGAASVCMIDKSKKACEMLRKNAQQLAPSHIEIICANMPHFNPNLLQKSFDIVFLDPPFHTALLEKSLNYITKHHLLKQNGLLYIERAKQQKLLLTKEYTVLKETKVGDVHAILVQWSQTDE